MKSIHVTDVRTFNATDAMMTRFVDQDKISLANMISSARATAGERIGTSQRFWRGLPKETLVIVAGDMFANDAERAQVEAAAVLESVGGEVKEEFKSEPLAPANASNVLDAVSESPVNAAVAAMQAQTTQGATDVPGPFVLRCTHTPVPSWLRRDQPRKPGDVAKYRVVTDPARASVYKTRRQAGVKLFEVVSLADTRNMQAEIQTSVDAGVEFETYNATGSR